METPDPNAAPGSLFPLFLVEVIGDYDPMWSAGVSDACEVGYDSDDAESCICDSSDCRIIGRDESNGCYRRENSGDPVEDEQQNYGFPAYPAGLPEVEEDMKVSSKEMMKSCVSVDSASSPVNEIMNEMERSRRFWEACLASS
ncbi:hypothetical protein SAY87_007665 [Trapa incisa]|uniref:Uncharacterized protein n=1 Tax=Trapa incisa TaxID=236973 RepID=A0AAN7QFU6_9MYRT|nr:hypothetical protein SAY87_007665 [Trapa incisa]